MLPYGSLWKLDQMMQESTNAENQKRRPLNFRDHRRLVFRQRVAYLLIAVIVVSFFMFPYYLAHMRLLVHRLEKEKLGLAPLDGAAEENRLKFKQAVSMMRAQLRDKKELIVQEWERWMLFAPDVPLRQSQWEQLEHIMIEIGGIGAGSLWPFVDGSGTSSMGSESVPNAHVNSLSFFDTSSPSCIALTTSTGGEEDAGEPAGAVILFPDESQLSLVSDFLVPSWWTSIFGALLSSMFAQSHELHSCQTLLHPSGHLQVLCLCGGNAARAPFISRIVENPNEEMFTCQQKCIA